jgi:hypothetical protein
MNITIMNRLPRYKEYSPAYEEKESKNYSLESDHFRKMHLLLCIMDTFQINEVEFFNYLSDPNNRIT